MCAALPPGAAAISTGLMLDLPAMPVPQSVGGPLRLHGMPLGAGSALERRSRGGGQRARLHAHSAPFSGPSAALARPVMASRAACSAPRPARRPPGQPLLPRRRSAQGPPAGTPAPPLSSRPRLPPGAPLAARVQSEISEKPPGMGHRYMRPCCRACARQLAQMGPTHVVCLKIRNRCDLDVGRAALPGARMSPCARPAPLRSAANPLLNGAPVPVGRGSAPLERPSRPDRHASTARQPAERPRRGDQRSTACSRCGSTAVQRASAPCRCPLRATATCMSASAQPGKRQRQRQRRRKACTTTAAPYPCSTTGSTPG